MTAPNVRERILPRLIEDELKESFLDYSMSVIVQRALPDVRDGMKPVHRILYAMHELGLVPGRPYKKSATVVGDVLGKWCESGEYANVRSAHSLPSPLLTAAIVVWTSRLPRREARAREEPRCRTLHSRS